MHIANSVRANHGRPGFTLFEVGISLMIVSVAVITVLLLLPVGVKAQQMSRYQLYAAVKTNELVETFSQTAQDFKDINLFDHFLGANAIDRWSHQRDLTGTGTQFDLERLSVNALHGNYPVPLGIASRLDSPGNEIQNILDQGGHIYYCDPYPSKIFSRGQTSTGATKVESPELQKLIWSVAGYAQQNLLPSNPMVHYPKEFWPFPPLVRQVPVIRQFARGIKSRYSNRNDSGALVAWNYFPIDTNAVVAGVQTESDLTTQEVQGGFFYQEGHAYQGGSWEWMALQDENNTNVTPDPMDPLGRTVRVASKWSAGLHEFRRLANYHYLRIAHQLDRLANGASIIQADPPYILPFVPFTPPGQNPRWVDRNAGPGWLTVLTPPGAAGDMGVPAPACGLGTSNERGTDILYEDHETWNKDWDFQLRRGMPSLQRRVMYRTAALALWAKVGPTVAIDINQHPLSDLGTPADVWGTAWDPNVAGDVGGISAGLAALNALPGPDGVVGMNPLERVILPPNPGTIQASQVLALSYLAHAAMLVTGYKPPFIDNPRIPDPGTDRDLTNAHPGYPRSLPDRPYALLEKEAIPLGSTYNLAPFNFPVQVYSWLRAYYPPGNVNPVNPLPPLTDAQAANPMGPASSVLVNGVLHSFFALDADGNPIRYRRFAGPYSNDNPSATVVNPNPPPYADTGSFDYAGRTVLNPWGAEPFVGAANTASAIDATKHWRVWQGDNFVPANMDSRWARNAHETFMRWAMAFISENPYDVLVPRPFNRQIMTDKPMYSWNMFDLAGNARRSPTLAPASDANSYYGTGYYPILWGSNRAISGLSWWSPNYLATRSDYTYYVAPAGRQAPPGTQFGTVRGDMRIPPPIAPATTPAAKGAWDDSFSFYRWNISNAHGQQPGTSAPTFWYDRIRQQKSPSASQYQFNNPFAPAERCRTIIFWAADWKSYEDAESIPSAPIDITNMRRSVPNLSWTGQPHGIASTRWGNPEQLFVWANPERDGTLDRPPKFAVMVPTVAGGTSGDVIDSRYPGIYYKRGGYQGENKNQWSFWWSFGYWGADRNQNGVYDRGPIPSTSRMRATEVARFNYYDPVGWTTLRN
jgi:hypothetical protein